MHVLSSVALLDSTRDPVGHDVCLGLQNAFMLYFSSWYCPEGHGRQTLSVVASDCWRYIPLEVQYCRLVLQVLSVVKYSPGLHSTVFSGGDCTGCKTKAKGTWHARRVSSRPARFKADLLGKRGTPCPFPPPVARIRVYPRAMRAVQASFGACGVLHVGRAPSAFIHVLQNGDSTARTFVWCRLADAFVVLVKNVGPFQGEPIIAFQCFECACRPSKSIVGLVMVFRTRAASIVTGLVTRLGKVRPRAAELQFGCAGRPHKNDRRLVLAAGAGGAHVSRGPVLSRSARHCMLGVDQTQYSAAHGVSAQASQQAIR